MKKLLAPFHFLAFLLAALLIACAAAFASTVHVGPDRAGPVGQRGYLLVECQPFLNVGQNQKATVAFDNLIGYTIDRIILEIGGAANTKANHTNIKLIANEKPIFEDTGARIDTRMQYRGIAANAAYLTLDFSEIKARTIVGQRVGSIDTVSAGIRKLTAEIDIGAAAAAPTLKAFAMLSDAPQTDPGTAKRADTAPLIAKVISKVYNPGAAGEFIFPFEYQRGVNSFVKRIHLSGATVTDARLKKNGMEIWKASAARNNFIQTEFGRTTQANWFVVDFIVDGNLSDALPLVNVKSLEPYLTANGAGNVTVVAELLDRLENN
jgi:hypothetical protein